MNTAQQSAKPDLANETGITVTLAAAGYLQKRLQGTPSAMGLRFGLSPSGCSGFAYMLDVAELMLEDDLMFESSGIKIIVAKKQLKFLKGTIIDCLQDGVNEYLKFNNPNVKGECGCGESVSIEE